MPEYKIIHDTIHGSIKLSGLMLELMETPELQRLSGIRQLGLAHLVFPGANHTRLEHSLGTSAVANRIGVELALPEPELQLVRCAALLHDIGHMPYSHTLELLGHRKTGLSHIELTAELILGEIDAMADADKKVFGERHTIPELIEKHNLDPSAVVKLVIAEPDADKTTNLEQFGSEPKMEFFNPKRYLNQIICGEIDADQIDYLLRDSHYTGIAHGNIDIERLIQTMEIYNNDLVLHRRGLPAVEGMLVARSLMYSAIYFHKTVRIAELMLVHALEHAWDSSEMPPPLFQMVDYDLMTYLTGCGGFPAEIVRKLKYRKLYKRVFSLSASELDEQKRTALDELSDWDAQRAREQYLCDKLGIPSGYLMLDIPGRELQISEPRIRKTLVKIKDKGLKMLSSYSPLARALQNRPIPDWEIMVAVDQKYAADAAKNIGRYIFD